MAGQYLTMGELKQSALFRGDLEGFSDRHPDVNVNQEANLTLRHLWQKLANNDVPRARTPTAILNLPTAEAVLGGGYAEIPWPVDAVSVHALDARVGGNWLRVPHGDFTQLRLGPYNSQRGDYQFADDEGEAMWCERALPTNSTSGVGAIMLSPVPSGGQYVLWYLPQWVDVTNDASELPGQELWLQWAIWDLCVKLLIRDTGQTPEAQLQLAQNERDRVWLDIKPNTQRVVTNGPIEPANRYRSRRGGYRMIP